MDVHSEVQIRCKTDISIFKQESAKNTNPRQIMLGNKNDGVESDCKIKESEELEGKWSLSTYRPPEDRVEMLHNKR